jgi:predicted nucleic acid-binding Zn ribbon protein
LRTSFPSVSSPAVCVRCGEPRPDGHTHYCSRRCKSGAEKARRRERNALGLPPQTEPPGSGRSPRKRRSARRQARAPYGGFAAATIPRKRVQVPETADAQRKAELLVARGCCAYRNRRGFIRDIGVPRKAEHRGKVWTWGTST